MWKTGVRFFWFDTPYPKVRENNASRRSVWRVLGCRLLRTMKFVFYTSKTVGLMLIWKSIFQRYISVEVQTALSAVEGLQCMLVLRVNLVPN